MIGCFMTCVDALGLSLPCLSIGDGFSAFDLSPRTQPRQRITIVPARRAHLFSTSIVVLPSHISQNFFLSFLRPKAIER